MAYSCRGRWLGDSLPGEEMARTFSSILLTRVPPGIGVGRNPAPIPMTVHPLISAFPFTLALSLMLTGGAPAQVRGSTVLNLSDAPGVNILNVTLSAVGIEDEQESDLSGTVNAILEIDPATDQVSELTLTSGDLTATDMDFSLGPLGLIAEVSLSGIKGVIATSPVGLVDAATGQFDGALHQVTLNQGAISGTSISGDVRENFSQSPVSGTGSGIGMVTITRTATEGNIVTYDILVVLPLEFSHPLQEGVDVLVDATIQMEGSIEVPLDPYLGWAEMNGIPEAPFEGDHDSDGIPNGLLWALGHSANDRPELFTPNVFFPGQVDLLIETGPNGTRAPIIVERSYDLKEWMLLDPFKLWGFENPVPAGEVWPIVLTLSGDRSFIRLRVAKP